MFQGSNSFTKAEKSTSKRVVRCNFCHAVILDELFRCPDCGQITEGNEKEVNTNVLADQIRAKLAKRKERIANTGECKRCGKKVLKGDTCSSCASTQFRNSVILIAFGSSLITLMLVYLLSSPIR